MKGSLRIKENPLLGQGMWGESRVGRGQNIHADILLKIQVFSKQSGTIHLSQIPEFCWHYCQYLLHLGTLKASQDNVAQHQLVNILKLIYLQMVFLIFFNVNNFH